MRRRKIPEVAAVNASGPFPHSYFFYKGNRVSHEGPLAGRASFLVSTAIEFLDSIAKKENISKRRLSILEIGSYDGWMAHKIWEAGYTRITALEPRKQNIARGKRLRKILDQEDTVCHIRGTVSEPPFRLRWRALVGRPYDVVISFGVIHHLDNPTQFVQFVKRLSKHSALVEGVTLDDGLVGTQLKSAIEPKDIAYSGRPLDVSIYGV